MFMALRKRAPGLVCLLLLTAAALLLAGCPTPAAPPGPDNREDTASILEEDTVHYENQPTVRIISLSELEPVDTSAKACSRWGKETLFLPAEAAEMAEILAELNMNDGTCIRLYATAEGLVYGAFLRPGGQWTRFVQLYDGQGSMPDYTDGVTLTAFSGVLGLDGFLLRTGRPPGAGLYTYGFYWFDSAGELQVMEPYLDPVSLDLDGDGRTELIYEVAEWWSDMAFFLRTDNGAVYQIQPFTDGSCALETVEREGPGPVRLIYRRDLDGRTSFCAVTLEDGQLRIEENIVYVPAEIAAAQLPADPTDEGKGDSFQVSLAGPDGRVAEHVGEAAAEEFWLMLWAGSGAVMVPTDAPLDPDTACTVTFLPETGKALSWTLDDQGVCRFSGLKGNYRMISTGLGSLPEWCYDTMQLHLAAAGTFCP